MLEIKNLHVSIDGKAVLKGLNLNIQAGEVHAIMGPNGSGKSTLASVLAGDPRYTVTEGEIHYQGENLLNLSPEARAIAGIFLAFQYPVEIPGVSNIQFLKAALNARRKAENLHELDAMDFMNLLKTQCQDVGIPEDLLYRSVNHGFSGGEKKRNEVLQMRLFAPKLCILDETDSGLDIDALQTVAQGVNALMSPERAFIVITHYQRLLDHIEPTHVHVLARGNIVKSGDKSLALTLEEKGYAWLDPEFSA